MGGDKDLNFDFSRKQIENPFKQERNVIDVCIMSPVAWTIQGLSSKYDCIWPIKKTYNLKFALTWNSSWRMFSWLILSRERRIFSLLFCNETRRWTYNLLSLTQNFIHFLNSFLIKDVYHLPTSALSFI